jgi:hypothetical protein
MRLKRASALLLLLLLPACADSATQLPGSIKLIDELPRVANSTAAPCRLQREIAAQNSYVDTIKSGKQTVYKAPCDIDPPQRVASKKAQG